MHSYYTVVPFLKSRSEQQLRSSGHTRCLAAFGVAGGGRACVATLGSPSSLAAVRVSARTVTASVAVATLCVSRGVRVATLSGWARDCGYGRGLWGVDRVRVSRRQGWHPRSRSDARRPCALKRVRGDRPSLQPSSYARPPRPELPRQRNNGGRGGATAGSWPRGLSLVMACRGSWSGVLSWPGDSTWSCQLIVVGWLVMAGRLAASAQATRGWRAA